MVLIQPVNPYVATQAATQQVKLPAPPTAVVTAKPATPAEKREKMRDREKQHREAEEDVEDEVEARGKLTNLEA